MVASLCIYMFLVDINIVSLTDRRGYSASKPMNLMLRSNSTTIPVLISDTDLYILNTFNKL